MTTILDSLEIHDGSWSGIGGAQHVFSMKNPDWPIPHIVRSDNIYFYDKWGNSLIDFSSGPVTSNLGHNNRRIIETIKRQAEKLSFACFRVARTDENVALAEKLAATAGKGYERVFLVSGGSEGIDTSIKFARQWAFANGELQRKKIVSLRPSYHGSLISTVGIGGDEVPLGVFEGMMQASEKIPAPLTYRPLEGLSQEQNEDRVVSLFEETLARVGPETVLAFVYEPVGGISTGCNVLSNRFLGKIRDICNRHGILMIADEVMTGAGRTGKFLATHHTPDAKPDLIVLAKGIGAGYTPLGALLAPAEMVDRLAGLTGYPFAHTVSANPMSCAVGLAALEETLERDLCGNAARTGAYFEEQLWSLANEIPVIGDVRGKGLLLAAEIVSDRATRQSFPNELKAPDIIRRHGFKHGLSLYWRRTNLGKFGEWIMCTPPLITTPEQIDDITTRFGAALKDFVDEAVRGGVNIG